MSKKCLQKRGQYEPRHYKFHKQLQYLPKNDRNPPKITQTTSKPLDHLHGRLCSKLSKLVNDNRYLFLLSTSISLNQ